MNRFRHPAITTSAAIAATIALGLLAACSSDPATNAPSDTSTMSTSPGSAAAGDTTPTTPPTDPSGTIPGDAIDPSHCAMSDPIDQLVEVDGGVLGALDRVSVHFTPCTVDQPTPNPIVYLLHGAGADETQWPDIDIFDAADRAVMKGTMPPSILVAPDAAGAYPCSSCVDDLFTHLVDEIEPLVHRTAPVDPDRRAIGGISRGGGLALQVAGFAPDQFVAVGAHSSVDAPDAALAAIAEAEMPVRLDAGDDDGLAAASGAMSEFLDDNGGRSELVVSPGGHDRDYWRSQADVYIAFYATYLL